MVKDPLLNGGHAPPVVLTVGRAEATPAKAATTLRPSAGIFTFVALILNKANIQTRQSISRR